MSREDPHPSERARLYKRGGSKRRSTIANDPFRKAALMPMKGTGKTLRGIRAEPRKAALVEEWTLAKCKQHT